MNKKVFIIIQCVFVALFSISLAISTFAALSKTTTINNLNHAFRGETNASHKYEIFAQKADAEGYKQIAKLFRAVSMAESIHRNNHKAVLLELGAKPDVVSYDLVKVRLTKQNLQSPLEGEKYENDIMYPEFISQATLEKFPSAVKTFKYAQDAEIQHEKLFKDALKNLGRNKPVNYCVSRITGATYKVELGAKCPVGKCGAENEYILVK